jgi:hypothetical protein
MALRRGLGSQRALTKGSGCVKGLGSGSEDVVCGRLATGLWALDGWCLLGKWGVGGVV